MPRTPMNITKMKDIINIGNKVEHDKPKKDYNNVDSKEKESVSETQDGSGWF